jgi:hypothetical protein
MRRIRIGLFAAVASLVAASAAQAGDVSASKNPWTSFKPGSSVTMRTKITYPKGMPDDPPHEHRMTLVSLNDEEYVLKSETKSEDAWTDLEEKTHSRKPSSDDTDKKPAPAQALGEEKLSVDGAIYVCKKTKTTSNGATEITWVHKQHGELKSETSGPGDKKSTTIVTALAKKVKVAGKEVSCRETKTSSSREGVESTIVILTSDAVPGGTVRVEVSGTRQGVSVNSVTEVTAFEAK